MAKQKQQCCDIPVLLLIWLVLMKLSVIFVGSNCSNVQRNQHGDFKQPLLGSVISIQTFFQPLTIFLYIFFNNPNKCWFDRPCFLCWWTDKISIGKSWEFRLMGVLKHKSLRAWGLQVNQIWENKSKLWSQDSWAKSSQHQKQNCQHLLNIGPWVSRTLTF